MEKYDIRELDTGLEPLTIEDEELLVCSKAFNAETSRFEDEDGPCSTAEN